MPLPPLKTRSAVSWRSITLGFLGVIFICALTPYNDYALNNTFLVGNNLPLGVVMLVFVMALLVNGPLSRFKSAWALSSGEVGVAMSMVLVSCCLPSSGLMRYFPPSLVTPWYHARDAPEWRQLADQLRIPHWLFPSFSGSKPSQWMNDPVVTGYVERWTGDGPPPYLAWLRPALTWGVFLYALYGALLCMVIIVRRQWYENERLPFPLATIYLSLIEQPKPGRWFNDLLRRRSFWIAFSGVFLLHLWNGCNQYWPRYFVEIPIHYNLWDIFAQPPWSYMDSKVKDATIYFTATGVAYFLTSSVSFSLFFFYLLRSVLRMWMGTRSGDPEMHGAMDQHFGGVIAFALTVLWIGRKHWWLVLRSAFGRVPDSDTGRYLPHRRAFWGLVGCTAVMIGWLWLAGAGLGGATVMVLLLLLLFMVITRIIAEAGLVHGQLQVGVYSPWQMISAAGWGQPVSNETFYLGSLLQSVHYDFREVMSVYASHAVKVADQTIFSGPARPATAQEQRRVGRRFIGVIVAALMLGYVVSFSSTLWMEYHYQWTKDVSHERINQWGAYDNSQWMIVGADTQYAHANYHHPQSVALNWIGGFIVTAGLGLLRLRFPGWPLHPVGFLMMYTYPSAFLWFSIMIGWLCKVVILRLMGPRGYVGAKPFFIGLIVGESVAAGFWLLMGLVLSMMNVTYRVVEIMPP